jgi:hypothetical protein
LYFASGAFNPNASAPTVSAAQQRRFYGELAETIDDLSSVGLASSVHRLIEMLQVLIPLDPRRVFLQVAALVRIGQQGGYNFESMGADMVVRIVERYLAEYRSLLQEDAECRVALREVLDVFVEAGWPAAQRTSYKLDEIFR